MSVQKSQFVKIPYNTWIDRNGITAIDSTSLAGVIPMATGGATQLIVAVDSSMFWADSTLTGGGTIEISVVYWDETGKPVSSLQETFALSAGGNLPGYTNAVGNYIPMYWSGDASDIVNGQPLCVYDITLASGFNILLYQVTLNIGWIINLHYKLVESPTHP